MREDLEKKGLQILEASLGPLPHEKNGLDWKADLSDKSERIAQHTALRRDAKMYPELAIRELTANALIHQDFAETGTGPMIEIFSDRLEIANPGTQ